MREYTEKRRDVYGEDNGNYRKGYDKENLDLMFANIDDATQTMESIISYIMSGQGKFNQVSDWQEFLDAVKEKCSSETAGKDKEIPVASWRKFYRIINNSITDNKIFARDIREEEDETRIGDALKYIKKNEVHVIDIAKLSEDKQSYVFGDAIRTIYDLRLGRYSGEEGVNPPSRVVIFIDELNKYASKETPKNSPILRQVLDVAERGRSLGVVLFAAEQFRSTNIQLGNDDTLQPLFKENSGNFYFVGEVFAASRDLIPNAQRDYFNENETRVLFEDLLREYFYDVLHKLYYEANRVKNDYKRQEEYLSKVAEYQKKEKEQGFVNEEERQKLRFDIDKAKKNAEDARKRLDKLDTGDSTSL